MKNYGFILIFFFYPAIPYSQVVDNFSDGNFTANPAWSGSTGQFIINSSQQLQLNNATAGSSYLSTPFSPASLDNFEWQIFVKQTFSPSGSNYGRIYLATDQSDPAQSLNGYFLQFGEAGSNDAIQLFRQTGLTSTSVCRATNGSIAASFSVRVKVTRENTGEWKLWADYSGGTNFRLEASGNDQINSISRFFVISCTYTSSNATKFYFDDISAGPQLRDTIPPLLQSINVQSSSLIDLHFSERLDRASAQSIANYSADNGLGNPVEAAFDPDNNTVSLTFDKLFSNGIRNHLSVSGITDSTGNVIQPVTEPFLFFQSNPVQPKDLIISEIFPDPVPSIGLPQAEFVEIFNRSANPVDLSGWQLSDGSTKAIFPPQIILPQEYWIVTATPGQFDGYGNVIIPIGFPTLNNTTDTLTLTTPYGRTSDSLNYSVSWYHDSEKADGGWSLELIDPDNVCAEEENWTASEDPSGGTPGKQNSVIANKPDTTGPKLLSIIAKDQENLWLVFNEKLDQSAVTSAVTSITPSIPISAVSFTDRSLRQIQIGLAAPLQFRQLYSVKVEDVKDCSGNPIQDDFNQIQMALPESADSLDVLVNELLFNPRPNGVDFLEVYNASDKFINLKNWKLAHLDHDVLSNVVEITAGDYILDPHSYLVFTEDGVQLKINYPQGHENTFFITALPSLPDDEGSIALVTGQGKVIDYFLYNKSLHSALIKDDEGVSLERISVSDNTNDRQNWKSASSRSGFATPGYVNSNSLPDVQVGQGNITVVPEIFVPGYSAPDFTRIGYSFEQTGYVANVKIVDQQGRIIKVISNNEILGFDGFFQWDGDRDDGTKARVGYYFVWFEVFDLAGTVKTFRNRVVVATR